MKRFTIIAIIGAVALLIGNQPLFAPEPPGPIPARVTTIEWNPSPDDGVAGYALYWAEAGEVIFNRVDVGASLQAKLYGFYAGTNYEVYVVAYDSDGVEGYPSESLTFTAKQISLIHITQLPSQDFLLTFTIAPQAPFHIEYTDDLNTPVWHVLSLGASDTEGKAMEIAVFDPAIPMRFYRASVP